MIHPDLIESSGNGPEEVTNFCKVKDSIIQWLEYSHQKNGKERVELMKEEIKEHQDADKTRPPAPTDNKALYQSVQSFLLMDGYTDRLPLAKKKIKRQTSFGDVTIRDYGMIIGDHPCCSYGPPVTLDWEYYEHTSCSLDDYEYNRPRRRSLRQMNLNYYKRKELLQLAGANKGEIKAATKAVNHTRRQRSLTRSLLMGQIIETGLESTRRKLKRLIEEDHWKKEAHLYK
uniref:Uncharacterized protein n=1 Tax=Ditylum brightwellii TaxID=49249 RepID=A0A6U3NW40_9STRA|mmetsp:Transcript_11746/g.17511  ORF Transcript_11746/g.17511 Transcript_11746/m.17511 type:complete len:230 (+) Transcript_11746:14-703(+)